MGSYGDPHMLSEHPLYIHLPNAGVASPVGVEPTVPERNVLWDDVSYNVAILPKKCIWLKRVFVCFSNLAL